MRLTGGSARGRRLFLPPGSVIRPTADRVRKTLFDILGSVEDAAVLDAYAGTGSVGMEALSRGAARAVFIEWDSRLAEALGRALAKAGWAERGRVLRRDVCSGLAWCAAEGERFDLLFVDPPYGVGLVGPTLRLLAAPALANDGGVLVVQHSCREAWEEAEPFVRFDQRRFGDTRLTFYRYRTQGRGA